MKKKLLAILSIGLMLTGVMGFAAYAEAIPEEEAEAMREEGTLESDALTGYEYSENTDRNFHMSIARGSGNHMYLVICDMIWKAMEQRMWSLILNRTVTAEENRRHHYEEHLEIAEAILAGEPAIAYEKMRVHMENLNRQFWN